jgi:hypothetical protein
MKIVKDKEGYRKAVYKAGFCAFWITMVMITFIDPFIIDRFFSGSDTNITTQFVGIWSFLILLLIYYKFQQKKD